MKITIEATKEEVKELLQAIGSSKEQLNIDTSENKSFSTKVYSKMSDNGVVQVVAGEKNCSILIIDSKGIKSWVIDKSENHFND